MRRFIGLVCLTLLPALESGAAATTAPGPSYEVEVLVFENRLPGLEAGELWVKDVLKPMTETMADAISIRSNPAADSALSQAAKTLQNDGEYRLLAHKRWVQNAEAKSTTKPVRIDNYAAGLDGVLRFYVSRFLHVELDLAFREGGGGLFAAAESTDPLYQISEQRRVRSRELHYFDHPKFGVLVRVAPLEGR